MWRLRSEALLLGAALLVLGARTAVANEPVPAAPPTAVEQPPPVPPSAPVVPEPAKPAAPLPPNAPPSMPQSPLPVDDEALLRELDLLDLLDLLIHLDLFADDDATPEKE
jgi:hypothetical protein